MQVTIELRNVFGNIKAYPACSAAREFAEIDDAMCAEVLTLLNNEDAKRRHVDPCVRQDRARRAAP